MKIQVQTTFLYKSLKQPTSNVSDSSRLGLDHVLSMNVVNGSISSNVHIGDLIMECLLNKGTHYFGQI